VIDIFLQRLEFVALKQGLSITSERIGIDA